MELEKEREREAERNRERKQEKRQQRQREEERDAERQREGEREKERHVLMERVRQLESDSEVMKEKERAWEQEKKQERRRERDRESKRESQRQGQREQDELHLEDADKLLSGIEELLHTTTRLAAAAAARLAEAESTAAVIAGVAASADGACYSTRDQESRRKQVKLGVGPGAALPSQAPPPSPRGFLLPSVDEYGPLAQIANTPEREQGLHTDTPADWFAQLQRDRADSQTKASQQMRQSPRRGSTPWLTGEGLSREEEWLQMWGDLKTEHRSELRNLRDSFQELLILKQAGDSKAAVSKVCIKELETRLLKQELRELEHQDAIATSGRLVDKAIVDLQYIQAHLVSTESKLTSSEHLCKDYKLEADRTIERIKVESAAQTALEFEKRRDIELAFADARKELDAKTEEVVGLTAEVAELSQQVMQLKCDQTRQFETGEAEMKDLMRIYDSRIARMDEQEHELSNSLDFLTREREKQDGALASSEREKRELELQLQQHLTQASDKIGLLESELKQANCKLEKQRESVEKMKIQVERERQLIAESVVTVARLVSESDSDVKGLIHIAHGTRAYCEAHSAMLVKAQADAVSAIDRERDEGVLRRETLHETINQLRVRTSDLEDQNLLLCNTKRHLEEEVRSQCYNLATEWDLLAYEVQVSAYDKKLSVH